MFLLTGSISDAIVIYEFYQINKLYFVKSSGLTVCLFIDFSKDGVKMIEKNAQGDAMRQVNIDVLLPGLNEEWEVADVDEQESIVETVQDYVKIAKFAASIGLPFCVEPNPYYRAPHAVLHEVGHWAVKPDSYIETYRVLSARDFPVDQADVIVDERFGSEEVLKGIRYYEGANDRMPDWDLPDGLDPTANEKAVRAWTRHAITALELTDPVIESRTQPYATQGTGDKFVSKGSSFRTWTASAIHAPEALAEFAAFEMDPENGIYRPPHETLVLPNPIPYNFVELEENVVAMGEQHSDRLVLYKGQWEDWREQVTWKYSDLF